MGDGLGKELAAAGQRLELWTHRLVQQDIGRTQRGCVRLCPGPGAGELNIGIRRQDRRQRTGQRGWPAADRVVGKDQMNSFPRRLLWHVASNAAARRSLTLLSQGTTACLRLVARQALGIVGGGIEVGCGTMRVMTKDTRQLSAAGGIATALQHSRAMTRDA